MPGNKKQEVCPPKGAPAYMMYVRGLDDIASDIFRTAFIFLFYAGGKI